MPYLLITHQHIYDRIELHLFDIITTKYASVYRRHKYQREDKNNKKLINIVVQFLVVLK